MTSFTAKSANGAFAQRLVVFVTYPNVTLLDLAGPLQVFSSARCLGDDYPPYETAIVSVAGDPVTTNTIVDLQTDQACQWAFREIDTLVVVGGNGAYAALRDSALLEQIAALAARARRVSSVCTGALVLAATGLLDDRHATTHWEHCAHMADAFPKVRVDVDPIYVRDGPMWTSAGVTAGIDMALAMVEEDLGHDAALELAQSLVTYMARPGGQSQFSPALERQRLDRSTQFDKLHTWIDGNLARDLRVDRLAEFQGMSARNFHRRYRETMGIPPAKAVETLRVRAARDLLETTAIAIKAIARQCGFGDEERMRRAFVRALAISPSEYRERFRSR